MRWLKRRLRRYSPDAALRWMFRHGVRKGMKRGIEKGKQSVPPILNRCMMHNLPTYPRIVQLADTRWVEVWCCPLWDAHTKDMSVQQQFPDVERFTDKVASTVTQQPPGAKLLNYLRETHSDAHAGPETTRHRAAQFPQRGKP